MDNNEAMIGTDGLITCRCVLTFAGTSFPPALTVGHCKMSVFSAKHFLLSIIVHALMTMGEPIDISYARSEFIIQTSAVCSDEYSWMENHLEQSPCLVASYVLGACFSESTSPDPRIHRAFLTCRRNRSIGSGQIGMSPH